MKITNSWVRAGAFLFLLCFCWSWGQAQMVVTLNVNQAAQLMADAGTDGIHCIGDTSMLGGAPTANGGTAPFTYSWAPNTDISSNTVANPMAWPSVPTTWVVTITDDNGCTSMDTVTLSPDTCVGIRENSWASRLDLFPNPTRGAFTLSLETLVPVQGMSVEVLTLMGQKVFRNEPGTVNGAYKTNFDLSSHGSGVYLVRINGNGQSIVRKLIVE